ncbi:hypothetical protein [Mesorhizobium sp.]|uniref:hypothetical protein n=1 Tax=Mesorhizobium sp. TaxID=1871066 RepID=UPI000FE9FEA0|nr:hypothetical protein [Mesorhizobium sp.]RWQ49000.1 MAG: hypothetical protein EOS83_24745 [Mesorhizobium sp.]
MNFDEWSELCFRSFSPTNTEIPSPTAPPAGLPEASRETYVPTDAESSFRLGIFLNVFRQSNAELKFHLHQQVAHDARLAEIGWGNSGRRVAAGCVAVLGDLQSFFPRPTGPALAKLFARIGRMTDLICLVIPYP